MSYERRQPTIVSTARELFGMHPGIGAMRTKTDSIEVYPFRDTPSPFMGFHTLIHFARESGKASRLALTSHVVDGEIDTQVVFNYPGIYEAPELIAQRTISPARVFDMASAGVDLLNGYVSLPSDERDSLPSIPFGNEKVFDYWDPANLDLSPTFIAARELLLLEPYA